MPFVRVTDFEAEEEAIEKFAAMIDADPTPPEGIPATGITVLANRAHRHMRVVIFFDTEQALEAGHDILETMSPPDDSGLRRTNVELLEVVTQHWAPTL